jgi:hypothetical protein
MLVDGALAHARPRYHADVTIRERTLIHMAMSAVCGSVAGNRSHVVLRTVSAMADGVGTVAMMGAAGLRHARFDGPPARIGCQAHKPASLRKSSAARGVMCTFDFLP